MAGQQLNAQQKAFLFNQATRKTNQMIPTRTVNEDSQTVQFDFPKARLLSKLYFEVEAIINLKSTNAAVKLKRFSPYQLIRKMTIDLNNGFSPVVLAGESLYLSQTGRFHPEVLKPSDSPRAMTYVENKASGSGVDNKVKFQVEVPFTLNDRDPVGLILLQNAETLVNLTIDTGKAGDIFDLGSGESATLKSMKMTPMLETFTIPPTPDAFPDISVLKLVSDKTEKFAGNGQNIVTLQTGIIYRKLYLMFLDDNGVPLKDSDFQGNLELVFNQADIPFSVKPSIFAAKNHSDFGHELDEGVYVFDFANQGIPNQGGSRDYIDTERLTEFWLRFSTQKAGRVVIVAEKLSRLR